MTRSPPITRREWLRLGALAPLGLGLPRLLSAAEPPRARSCLLIFLEGGPSHIDLWDMKPEAPAEVRGAFKPIATRIPGVHVCEHLPLSAPHWHRFAQVRSVHHAVNDHNAGAYYALTGHSPVEGGRLVVAESPKNFPPIGAVAARFRPTGRALPDFIHIPEIMSNNGFDIPGESAGFLGPRFDPFVTGDPSLPGYRVPGLAAAPELSLERLGQRDQLARALDRELGRLADDAAAERLDALQRKALTMIASPAVRRAFDLSGEPAAVRERYGVDPGSDRAIEARKFGGLPHLGQCMLLARRLLEAGVRLITLVSGRRIDQAWDTHRDHFPLLKRSLLPPLDRALSALLEDMAARGLLDETLIVVMGEFGRTPKLGYVTSGAGAAPDGRDHWPYCYTVLFAGAGIRAGTVHGASDRQAAYPSRDPATPEDIAATVYNVLGVPADAEVRDAQDKPYAVTTGTPIRAILS